jgi:hypothetical protein
MSSNPARTIAAMPASPAIETIHPLLTPDEPLAQGDILKLHHKGADCWSGHFGLLVTADCDLAQRKHAGYLSYVPVIPLEVYTAAVHIPSTIEKITYRWESQLEQLFVPLRKPSLSRLREQIERGRPTADILETIEAEEQHLNRLNKQIRHWALLVDAAKAGGDDGLGPQIQRLRAITASQQILSGSKSDLWPNKLTSLTANLGSLAGDRAVVGSISQSLRSGYVVYLRLVRELHESDVATSWVDEKREPSRYRAARISRLPQVLVHRLVQMLGQCFGDIGIPTEIEDDRNRSIDEIGQLLARTEEA